MAWPTVTAGQQTLASQFNALSSAIQVWQGAVSGGGFALTNVASIAVTGAVTASNLVTFGASGASHAAGFVPDPGASAGSTRYLREDATWTAPPAAGAVAWGSITGTLASQTDLSTALAGKQATLTTGNLTEATSAVLTITGGSGAVIGTGLSIQVKQASGSVNGYLSSGDWTTFNNKQSALTLPLSIANGGTGQATAAAAFNALSPLTTLGDLLYASAANTSSRLAGNTTAAKQYLVQTGTGTVSAAPTWAAIAAADVPTLNQSTTGNAATATAATNLAGGLLGSVPYQSAVGATVLLAGNTVNARRFLIQTGTGTVSAAPAWGAIVAGDLPVFVASGASHAIGAVPDPGVTAGTTRFLREDATWTAPTFTTAWGSITGTLSSQTDLNTALAGKQATLTIGNFTEATSAVLTITGGTGSVIGSGLSVAVKQAATGQSGYLSNTDWNTFNGKQSALTLPLSIGQGGTGQTTASPAFNALSPLTTLGDLLYASAANTSTRLAGNTTAAKQFLVQTGTGTVSAAPIWAAIAVGDVPTLNQSTTGNAATATSATNVAGGSVGAVHYQSAVGATAFLTGNTANQDQVLVSHGTGTLAQAPTLVFAPAISAANMSAFPTFNQNTTGTAANVTGTVAIGNGGTGQTTAAAALTALGGVNATQAAAAAPVQSVFGRTGAVAAASADYSSFYALLTGFTTTGNVGVNVAPRKDFSVGVGLDVYNGAATALAANVSSIRASTTNLILNATSSGGAGTGAVYLNFDSGLGGVNFCNGASAIAASVDATGFATFAAAKFNTPANIVFGSGWTSYTPTVTASGSMTVSALSILSAQFLRVGPICDVSIRLTLTLGGTAGSFIFVTLPVSSAGDFYPFTGYLHIATQASWIPAVCYPNTAGSATLQIFQGNAVLFTLGSTEVFISGSYRCV
jgi:hypothetical protein